MKGSSREKREQRERETYGKEAKKKRRMDAPCFQSKKENKRNVVKRRKIRLGTARERNEGRL